MAGRSPDGCYAEPVRDLRHGGGRGVGGGNAGRGLRHPVPPGAGGRPGGSPGSGLRRRRVRGTTGALASNPELRCRLGQAGPTRVAHLNWNDLSRCQGDVYGELLEGGGRCPGPGSREDGFTSGAVRRRVARDRHLHSSVGDLAVLRPVRRRPRPPAVVDGGARWTYGQLRDAAGRVAGALQARGIGSGDTVAVCLPRSKEAIAAMLGTWGSGAAYVPLDPQYPRARLTAMAERAG